MGMNCPVCQWDIRSWHYTPEGGYEIEWCRVCRGSFVVSQTFIDSFRDNPTDQELKRYLSAYIRQHSKGTAPLILTTENWRGFAEGIRSMPVATKIESLLGALADESSYPGALIPIETNKDYPLANTGNPIELNFLLEHLKASGFLHLEGAGGFYHATVLAKGWERLQANTDKGIPGRCFVAMSFDESLEKAYNEAIEPALRSCGLDPRRVDKILDNRDINEKMIAELRTAELVVADFTQQKAGVYFEAGFAQALGREVFWCCRDDEKEKVHFDARQFNFIFWTSLEDLKERLIDKIKALGLARK